MNCPNCNNNIANHIETCPWCGFKLNHIKWAVVTREYPPNDIIIESLLKSANIPVRLTKKEVSGFPVAIGPLAEVQILVPDIWVDDAKTIIFEYNSHDQATTPPKEET